MPRKHRTQAEWQRIFAEQSQSGLSVKAYCERHGILRQTFHSRKSDFNCAKLPSRALVKVEKPKRKEVAAITCQFKDVELACNDSINPQWFAEMVKALTQ
jgi:transposase-like protein